VKRDVEAFFDGVIVFLSMSYRNEAQHTGCFEGGSDADLSAGYDFFIGRMTLGLRRGVRMVNPQVDGYTEATLR